MLPCECWATPQDLCLFKKVKRRKLHISNSLTIRTSGRPISASRYSVSWIAITKTNTDKSSKWNDYRKHDIGQKAWFEYATVGVGNICACIEVDDIIISNDGDFSISTISVHLKREKHSVQHRWVSEDEPANESKPLIRLSQSDESNSLQASMLWHLCAPTRPYKRNRLATLEQNISLLTDASMPALSDIELHKWSLWTSTNTGRSRNRPFSNKKRNCQEKGVTAERTNRLPLATDTIRVVVAEQSSFSHNERKTSHQHHRLPSHEIWLSKDVSRVMATVHRKQTFPRTTSIWNQSSKNNAPGFSIVVDTKPWDDTISQQAIAATNGPHGRRWITDNLRVKTTISA